MRIWNGRNAAFGLLLLNLPLAVLPVRSHIGAGPVQMHVLIDVIDPRYRDEMMVLSVRRTLFGELDLVGTFEVVDLAHGFSVR